MLAKIYDAPDGTFSLNDMIELVGIVSLDPSLAQLPFEGTNDIFAEFQQQENAAKNPPASLVPRIHVLQYKKLLHSNPLLPVEKSLLEGYVSNNISQIQQEASVCRQEVLSLLSNVLLGDVLAAEYLLCHLISRIYHRKDVLCLGKFSLNLFNVPTCSNYTKRLATIMQLLVTKSHYLPLTVSNMNSTTFVPK